MADSDKERQYASINLSDVDAIKGLIKFRSKLDKYYGVKAQLDVRLANVTGSVDVELITLYASLDVLIERCGFNWKQLYITKELMKGKTEQDIASFFKMKISSVSDTLSTVANRIKKLNYLDWKYNHVYMNHIRSTFAYKMCPQCNPKEPKPATEDFFGRDSRNKDGLKSTCKKCDTMRKGAVINNANA